MSFSSLKQEKDQMHFTPIPVQIGQRTQDGQWVEITQGLTAGNLCQQGSFF
jgi:cobalt-zinc-cadmium efflux system membrane fusion protein